MLDRQAGAYIRDGITSSGISPFDVTRLRERAEQGAWSWLFGDGPTVPDERDTEQHVFDVTRRDFNWSTASIFGLLSEGSSGQRSSTFTPEIVVPSARTLSHLSVSAGRYQWVFVGGMGDRVLATKYWSVRALGGNPVWIEEDELASDEAPDFVIPGAVALFGPDVDQTRLLATAERWTTRRRTVAVVTIDVRPFLPGESRAVFAQHRLPVQPYHDRLRVPTPPLPTLERPLRPFFGGIAEYRILSPERHDPDGLILARDAVSDALVQPGRSFARRVTRSGVAEAANVLEAQLVDLPLVDYRDAVAAPFVAQGFDVLPSDKGSYQQRVLHLAGGLLYLAWLLRHPQSKALLALFFVRPPGERSPSYRRAVRFDELRDELYRTTRPNATTRLTAAKRVEADDWLDEWANRLLERDLLLAGYLLDCESCHSRIWYRADRVGQKFDCVRCGASDVIPIDAVRTFRLSEAFYILQEQGGEVVTLALATLRAEAALSFLYLPETLINDDDGGSREVDIAALVDGELVLVEAKTNNTLTRREVRKYGHLARRCGASRIVFATTAVPDALCGLATCVDCENVHSRNHADRAWDAGARVLIEELRTELESDGVLVESWCAYHLVGQHPHSLLEPFIRRPAPTAGTPS